MEKISHLHVDRVINDKEDPKIIKDVITQYHKMGKERLPGELDKTQRDKDLIDFAQKSLNEYLLKYKRERIYDTPLSNIHIMPSGGIKDWLKIEKGGGIAHTEFNACAVDKNNNDITFSIIMFHELYHLKTHIALRAGLGVHGLKALKEHRSGVGVFNSDNSIEYFNNLKEQINHYLCNEFFEEKIKNSDLFNKTEVEKYEFTQFVKDQVKNFQISINDLFESNKEEFTSKEQILEIVFNADMNGRLLPLARLIEKTYGKGFFRKVGEQSQRTFK